MRFFTITTLTLLVAATVSRATAEPLVGAYYYPWYSTTAYGGHTPDQSVRGNTLPQQSASLGQYSSFDPATISSQIDQSHRGNIDFWALSWWGPNDISDQAIRNTIMPHARASELDYAIHYESQRRLGDASAPNYSNLVNDFRYLANNYFSDPNYLRIDGRPVVFMYLTRAYFNQQASRDVVANLRYTMEREYGVDPYIIGDDVFGGSFNADRAKLWDAVTTYDVYGTSLKSQGSTTAGLDQLANTYDTAINALAGTGVGFVPAVSPGFNDNAVRYGHDPAPRYLTDESGTQFGNLFQQMLTDVAVPRVDPTADNLLMVNSFNEWHEDTQIEQSVVTGATTNDASGFQYYTQGNSYEGYGARYLDILRQATTTDNPASQTVTNLLDNAGFVDGLYRSVLGRRSDRAGMNVWLAEMQAGMSRSEVAKGFMFSREHLGHVIDHYYQDILGRPADAAGIDYWVGMMASGMTGPEVVVSFLTSGEYLAAHPSDADYVRGIYEDVLHRPADPAGLSNFVSQLANGESREDLVLTFLNSAERRNQVIDSLYRDLLARGVDPTGLQTFGSMVASGDADFTDVAIELLTSGEFQSLAQRRLDSSDWYYWYNVAQSLPVPDPTSSFSTLTVPEPSSLALTLAALIILASGRRRRR